MHRYAGPAPDIGLLVLLVLEHLHRQNILPVLGLFWLGNLSSTLGGALFLVKTEQPTLGENTLGVRPAYALSQHVLDFQLVHQGRCACIER